MAITDCSWKCVDMRRKTQKKFEFTRSASVHAQDMLHREDMEGMCIFVINGKVFWRFLPGFCVIIIAYAVNVSFGVRYSRNEAQFAPSHFAPPKNHFKPP